MTPESSTQQTSPAENGDTLDDLIAQMRDDEGGDTKDGASRHEDSEGSEDERGDAWRGGDSDDSVDSDDGDESDNRNSGERAQRVADGQFERRESARALPGLLGALVDAPFSSLAREAAREALEETMWALDEQKAARRLPPSPKDRITALLRAEGVLAYLLARELRDARPVLHDMLKDVDRLSPLFASVNLGQYREAWGDGAFSRNQDEVTRQFWRICTTSVKHPEPVNARCAGPTATSSELHEQMGLSSADRDDRAMTLLATGDFDCANNNTLAAALVGLLAALNAPAGEVQQAIDHALNVGREALPNVLATVPAALSIHHGRPLADDPQARDMAGQLIGQIAALLSAVLSAPEAGPPPPTPAERADPADTDDSTRPASAAA
jgi:hypothetical protein